VWRPTLAEVDLNAFRRNVAAFVDFASPSFVCAVVKADGYGHGAVPCATAAVRAGASWLGVALVEEAVELRNAGITVPILLLSEFPDGAEADVVAFDLTPTIYSLDKVRRLSAVAAGRSTARPAVSVHIKVDTGMHRVGVQPSDALALAREVATLPSVELGGVFTHFAVADDPDNPYTARQLDIFGGVLDELRAAGVDPGIVHSANSAGTLAHPAARFDMVRVGVSLYGNDPDGGMAASTYGVSLEPVLRLVSRVSHVKVLPAGERVSYGLRYELQRESVLATVPIGYADGLSRRYSSVGGEVLINGTRYPIAGRVTMDQIIVDCGSPDAAHPINAGDEVVLLGAQDAERITPWEMASKLDTIAYEITCALTNRVPRRYVDFVN
jgi:alanine racemase